MSLRPQLVPAQLAVLVLLALSLMLHVVDTTPAPLPAAIRLPEAAADTKALKDITFDDIKLDLKKDEPFVREKHLTESVEKLHGQRIRIRGWILPGFQQSGITQFVLVRDNKECCFGPGAALYDCILVEMQPGKSTEFTTRPVAVEGRFTLNEFKGPDGRQLAIYHLEGERVK